MADPAIYIDPTFPNASDYTFEISDGIGDPVHGAQIVILLCGGDKRTQQQDIRRAQKLAETS